MLTVVHLLVEYIQLQCAHFNLFLCIDRRFFQQQIIALDYCHRMVCIFSPASRHLGIIDL